WITHRAGSSPALVATASPVGSPSGCRSARSRRHSSRIAGPPRRWIAPSTPPPPRSDEFAALPIASSACSVMSPWTASIRTGPSLDPEHGSRHQVGRLARVEAARPQAPPGVEVERKVERRLDPPLVAQPFRQGRPDAAHRLRSAELDDLSRDRVDLGVAEHAAEHVLVPLVPPVQRLEPDTQAPAGTLDLRPLRRVRRRVELEMEARAGEAHLALVAEVPVERVPLDAGEGGDVAERRPRRALRPVQLDRRLDDAAPRLLLALGALLQLVLPCHRNKLLHKRVQWCIRGLHYTPMCNERSREMETRIDHIPGGIYRIATMTEPYGITFNQFLIDDEQPTLVHTGEYGLYENVRGAIREVLDPATLAHVVLLHWEGDENGGMDRFMDEAPRSELVGSALSIALNASGFGVVDRVRGFMDGETLELGRHTLRFLETPHVHHWDSMMVFEESTAGLFPSDLFLQLVDQQPVVTENMSDAMCEVYRQV